MQPIFYKDNGKTLICEKKTLSLTFNRPLSTKTNKNYIAAPDMHFQRRNQANPRLVASTYRRRGIPCVVAASR